ncbi:hypothetical protein P153DRAFT_357620 [Dothidotthia symphoricarpi CBS 119687]|uniref:Uncharacterized protein n=1 Tax=Dothidotthia symphoricarpi CBS 119687 TaxID=1392245 RepID=A0A6A6AE43_9PLEO|nr:uncharacterized protein P153DRAFT_357620 [Dothidotthia symphoricarpi CBS 119687]KAF2129177.1 hypothetical protein P153DRAFT_357620 [Dothidotthia symphoricarpi CBS 119687]
MGPCEQATFPLCNEHMTLRVLQKHIGRHQEHLALFALPLDLQGIEDGTMDYAHGLTGVDMGSKQEVSAQSNSSEAGEGSNGSLSGDQDNLEYEDKETLSATIGSQFDVLQTHVLKKRSAKTQFEWFVPADGISRVVIAADIERYPGPGASVKSGMEIRDYSHQPGYWIKACHTLTRAMIQDLKLDSQKWSQERSSARKSPSPEIDGSRTAPEDVQTTTDRRDIYPGTPIANPYEHHSHNPEPATAGMMPDYVTPLQTAPDMPFVPPGYYLASDARFQAALYLHQFC